MLVFFCFCTGINFSLTAPYFSTSSFSLFQLNQAKMTHIFRNRAYNPNFNTVYGKTGESVVSEIMRKFTFVMKNSNKLKYVCQ